MTIDPKEQKAKAAKTLAYLVVGIFGGSVVVQYAMVVLLIHWGNVKEIEYLEHLFNAWLPAIAGLASAAATYYFTKDKE